MKCKICGKEDFPDHYSDEFGIPMKEHQFCFNCEFWNKMYEEDKKRLPHTVAIIDGTHYIVGPENDSSSFRGFGGHKFQIEFNDGTKVVTTNLWCQGKPDEHWKFLFPDNAKFEYN